MVADIVTGLRDGRTYIMEENSPHQIDPVPPPESENPDELVYPIEDVAANTHLPISPPGWLVPGIPMARAAATLVPMLSTSPLHRHALSRLRAVGEIILVVPIAILGAVLGYLLARSGHPADERWLIIADNAGLGLGAASACIALVWLGRNGLSSIGLTARKLVENIALGLTSLMGFYFVLVTASFAMFLLYPDLIRESTTAQKVIAEKIPTLTFLQILLFCSCVAFYEEVIFRGFLLTRLYAIFRRWWLAVPIAAMAFGLPHRYEGPLAVAVITCLGLVMSILFVWRKSLVPAITMHLVHNVLVFAFLTYLAPKLESAGSLPG